MTYWNYQKITTDYSQDNLQESEANAYARDLLIPPDTWKKIIRLSVTIAKEDIICHEIGLRAMNFGIDPRIAVARYKHDSKMYRGRSYAPTRII